MISSLPLLREPHFCICRLVLDSAKLVFRRIYSLNFAIQWTRHWKNVKMQWNTQRHQCVCADKNYYTIYSVLPDSRSEPNTQALLTPGHSVSLQSVHLRGLTVEKEKMKEGMNRKNSTLSLVLVTSAGCWCWKHIRHLSHPVAIMRSFAEISD